MDQRLFSALHTNQRLYNSSHIKNPCQLSRYRSHRFQPPHTVIRKMSITMWSDHETWSQCWPLAMYSQAVIHLWPCEACVDVCHGLWPVWHAIYHRRLGVAHTFGHILGRWSPTWRGLAPWVWGTTGPLRHNVHMPTGTEISKLP